MIRETIDSRFDSVNMAAMAVETYWTQKGARPHNYASTMYRIYNWKSGSGPQPRRSSVQRYAIALGVPTEEFPEKEPAPEERGIEKGTGNPDAEKTIAAVTGYIGQMRTPASYVIIEQTARGLVDVETEMLNMSAQTCGMDRSEFPAQYENMPLLEERHKEFRAADVSCDDRYGEKGSETGCA